MEWNRFSGNVGFRKICGKEKSDESEEQPQSRARIRRYSRLMEWRRFFWELGL
jgi:hypothetical protein